LTGFGLRDEIHLPRPGYEGLSNSSGSSSSTTYETGLGLFLGHEALFLLFCRDSSSSTFIPNPSRYLLRKAA